MQASTALRATGILTTFLGAACVVGPTNSTGGGEGLASTSTSKGTSEPVPTTTVEATNDASATSNSTADTAAIECDLVRPMCPKGHKCNPSGLATGLVFSGSWICVALATDAKPPGATCSMFNDELDGTDDCETGSVCLGDGSNSGIGTCFRICNVHDDPEPTCPPDEECYEPGCFGCFWGLCKRPCDPRESSTCPMGDECLPTDFNSFHCSGDLSGDQGQAGDSCEFQNACDPGLLCLDASQVPGCNADAAGCCSPFCSTDQPNTCPGAKLGVLCLSWFSEGEPHLPQFENLGICTLPKP